MMNRLQDIPIIGDMLDGKAPNMQPRDISRVLAAQLDCWEFLRPNEKKEIVEFGFQIGRLWSVYIRTKKRLEKKSH